MLSFDKDRASELLDRALRQGNYVLCFTFAVEVLLRWAAAGFQFWTYGFNVTEAVLAVVSVADAFVEFSGLDKAHPLLYVLRSTRSLRILRVARFYKGWLRVLELIALSVPSALSALSLLVVFLLTAAVVGMQVRGF